MTTRTQAQKQMQNEWKRMFGTPQNPKRPNVGRVRVPEDPWVREFGEPAPARASSKKTPMKTPMKTPKKTQMKTPKSTGRAAGRGQRKGGVAGVAGGGPGVPGVPGVLVPRVEARMRRYKAMRTANTTARQLMETYGIGRAEVDAEALRLRRRMPGVSYGVRRSLAVNALVKRRKAAEAARQKAAQPSWPFMEALLAQQQAARAGTGPAAKVVNAVAKVVNAKQGSATPLRGSKNVSNSGREVRRNRVRALIREHGLTKPQVNARKAVLRGRYVFPDDLNYTELAVRELARRR